MSGLGLRGARVERRRAGLAVAGLGRIGRLHAGNAARAGLLVRVVDVVAPLARELADSHRVPWSTSFADALADPAVDGVVVASPTASHAEMVVAAARAGKHVLCEKPLGFDAAASRAAVDAARCGGVSLQVGFQRRFDPDWQALAAQLAADVGGPLRLLRCSHRNMAPPAAGAELGSLLVDVAIHDLDAARWLGGEIDEVYATGSELECAVALRFASGAVGLLDCSRRASYGFELSAEAVLADATLRVGWGHRDGTLETLRNGVASAALPTDHARRQAAAYVRELEHFAEVVAGAAEPIATGEDALIAFELALAAERSMASGHPVRADEPAAAASSQPIRVGEPAAAGGQPVAVDEPAAAARG